MSLVLHSPLDMHLHLRDEKMLQIVAPLSAYSFAGAIIMPNLVPPITTTQMVQDYKKRIKSAIGNERFEPMMTLFFSSEYDYDFLATAKEHISAIKLYPAGATTNSDGGVGSFSLQDLAPTLEAMNELEIPLCVHGETHGFVMDREKEFLPIYEMIASSFPNLKVIMEHITTKESAALVHRYDNLFATITLHHLLITLDDVAGGMLQPHLFCKPIAKRYEDRDALLALALSADKKVMFGSDSAPHPIDKKESCGCAAGVFTAPIALCSLAQLFEAHGKLENLQAFVSDNAREIYGITPIEKYIRLEKQNWKIPQSYENVVPMSAGHFLEWNIVSVE